MTGAPPRDVEPGEAPLLARWRDRSRCPDPTLLLPALAGTLPEPLKGVVATHLAECSICTELASALADAAMPTEQEVTRISERIDRSRRNHLLYRWTALAAAAVIVTVAGGAYVITRWERTVVPPVHSADAAPAPAPRDPVLALAAPAIELPPEFLTLRGDARDTYAAALERALEVFKRGDYRLAAARFERVKIGVHDACIRKPGAITDIDTGLATEARAGQENAVAESNDGIGGVRVRGRHRHSRRNHAAVVTENDCARPFDLEPSLHAKSPPDDHALAGETIADAIIQATPDRQRRTKGGARPLPGETDHVIRRKPGSIVHAS